MNDEKNIELREKAIEKAMNKLTYQVARAIRQTYGIEDVAYCNNTAKVIVEMVFVKAFKQFRERPVEEFNQIMETMFNDLGDILSVLVTAKKTLNQVITEMDEKKQFSYIGKDGRNYYSREALEEANHFYNQTMYTDIETSHKNVR